MFEAIGQFFVGLFERVVVFFSTINVLAAAVDIAVVAFVVYQLVKLVRNTSAEQLIKGFLFLVGANIAADIFNLQMLEYLIGIIFDNALIVLVVVFQPEIRRILEELGHVRIGNAIQNDPDHTQKAIVAVCEAMEQLQRQRMGALVVFERETNLGNVIETGTLVDADPTPELVGNIFFNKAPLHDGAMIIRNGRVCAAGCILTLTNSLRISSSLGTRHRAAIGMSEKSDAVVVVVSEETGTISLAIGGNLTRDYTATTLRVELEKQLLPEKPDDDNSSGFRRFLNWFSSKKNRRQGGDV